jgi:hypothetical protein
MFRTCVLSPTCLTRPPRALFPACEIALRVNPPGSATRDNTQLASDRVSASAHYQRQCVAECRNDGTSPPATQLRDNSLTKLRAPRPTIVNDSSKLSHNIVGWLDLVGRWGCKQGRGNSVTKTHAPSKWTLQGRSMLRPTFGKFAAQSRFSLKSDVAYANTFTRVPFVSFPVF